MSNEERSKAMTWTYILTFAAGCVCGGAVGVVVMALLAGGKDVGE